ECLETDPALAARILRVVNSSLFGPSRHVTDLNQALTLLGIRPLKMLVLGFSLPKELFSGLQAQVLANYWRQTLVKAVAARELSHCGLPAGLCAAISRPPDENRINDLETRERTVPRMLHLADLLARLVEQPFGSALRDLLAVGSRYCDLTYEKLQPIVITVD